MGPLNCGKKVDTSCALQKVPLIKGDNMQESTGIITGIITDYNNM